MKKQGFFNKLKEEKKLEIVEPSQEIADSYIEKSIHSIKAAQALLKIDLVDESVSMSYYSMYHCLMALMRKCGIKCENHAGNILLLKKLFGNEALFNSISSAKTERIDKQYYVDFKASKKDAEDMVIQAQDFTREIKCLIERLNSKEINEIRSKFDSL